MKKIFSLLLIFALLSTTAISTNITASAATSSSKAGKVNITSGKLNVRQSKSTNSNILKTLTKSNYVTVIEKSGSWYKIEYASNKYGYVAANFIKELDSSFAATINITSGHLNVRKSSSSSAEVKSKLYKGNTVVVFSQNNGWSRIVYKGISTGYVSSSFIKRLTASTTQKYSAIQLNLKNYKQTDSRWKDVTIGTKGYKLGAIGCATTAIAIMESYRTKTTITPDQMAKKLTYTAGGAVYWPSNFKFTLENNYYNIYQTLKSGKPVLFGVKNKYGSQHWVVITGFKGGDTLSASRFVMNDPGSNSRNTVQHILNEYPTFYKYAVYN